MQKKCLKCGHIHPNATGAALEACPRCGAIYSRVEAALAETGDLRPAAPLRDPNYATSSNLDSAATRTPPRAAAHRPRARAVDSAEFLASLQARTNYPTFRAIARFAELASYVLALLLAVLAGIEFKNDMPLAGVGTMAAAFYLAIAARFGKELFFMLADGCDALVHTAARRDNA